MKNILDTSDYKNWLQTLKGKIQQSQIKAAIQVNSELLRLYWQIGKAIAEKQAKAKWGDGFLQTLSADLCKEFPTMKGFSERNLRYCKKFYLFYNQQDLFLHQVGAEIPQDFFLFQIPWRHQVEIVTKSKTIQEALFYVHTTIENHWSLSVLEHQIAINLYDRQGKAITNFQQQLPATASDLAQELTKDPYVFDFLSMTEGYTEKELQQYLEDHMTKFLLELGKGFCFYGKQVHINVGGDDFYIDLLFYNAHLHCYVVVELKTTKFKPEHIGQLKFYVTVVNKQLRTEGDNPTIGLLICKDKNDIVAEYTLEEIHNPIGVSSYKLFDELSKGFQSSLPSIEEIEKQLID